VFHDIPPPMRERMRQLEEMRARELAGGSSGPMRLLSVPPETGRFLALLAAAAPEGRQVEIGTSGGYSALWLALAARARGRSLTTFEILEEKVRLARETFAAAGVSDVVELVQGDARAHLSKLSDVGFCFLDADKEIYSECYEEIVPRLVPGGLLVGDNAVSHAGVLRSMLDRALSDARVDALVVPIGSGELVCRKR
jgi:predicted O-methyltransferase YrrM